MSVAETQPDKNLSTQGAKDAMPICKGLAYPMESKLTL